MVAIATRPIRREATALLVAAHTCPVILHAYRRRASGASHAGPSSATGYHTEKSMTRSGSSKPTNPWPSFERLTLRNLLDSVSIGKPRSSDDADEAMAQSRRVPETASVTGIEISGGSAKPRYSWLGHASVRMRIPSAGNRDEPFSILFDPIASQR